MIEPWGSWGIWARKTLNEYKEKTYVFGHAGNKIILSGRWKVEGGLRREDGSGKVWAVMVWLCWKQCVHSGYWRKRRKLSAKVKCDCRTTKKQKWPMHNNHYPTTKGYHWCSNYELFNRVLLVYSYSIFIIKKTILWSLFFAYLQLVNYRVFDLANAQVYTRCSINTCHLMSRLWQKFHNKVKLFFLTWFKRFLYFKLVENIKKNHQNWKRLLSLFQ